MTDIAFPAFREAIAFSRGRAAAAGEVWRPPMRLPRSWVSLRLKGAWLQQASLAS